EGKYVYVLQGMLRGMAALERKLGAVGAQRLVDDFYKVARDVAFKHQALLDFPKVLDGGEIQSPRAQVTPAPQSTTGVGAETTIRIVVGLPIASEDDAGRAIKLALALVDALDGIGSDVEPELRLALAVQRGVAMVKRPSKNTSKNANEAIFEIEEATAAFAHKLARQARGAEI